MSKSCTVCGKIITDETATMARWIRGWICPQCYELGQKEGVRIEQERMDEKAARTKRVILSERDMQCILFALEAREHLYKDLSLSAVPVDIYNEAKEQATEAGTIRDRLGRIYAFSEGDISITFEESQMTTNKGI